MQALIDSSSVVQNQAMIYKTDDKQKGNNVALAQKIAEAIKASGMKAREVAEKCEVTPQAVNGWKTTGRISKEMLSVFADVVGFPLEHFIPSTSPPRADNHLKIVHLPKNRDMVSGESVLRLIALFMQSTDEGRKSLLEFAELTPKMLTARISANHES